MKRCLTLAIALCLTLRAPPSDAAEASPLLRQLVELVQAQPVTYDRCSYRACTVSSLTATSTAAGCLNVDQGVLYVDCANNRVGVNDTTPSVALDVTGTTATGGAADTDSIGLRLNRRNYISFNGTTANVLISADASNDLALQAAAGGDVVIVNTSTLSPATDNATTAGKMTNRWSNVYSYDLDLADDGTVTDTLTAATFIEGTDVVPSSNNGNQRANFVWSSTCFSTCSEDLNFAGPLHNLAADSVRIGCSWGAAGTVGGGTGVVVQIYDVTGAASVCSCTLAACNAAVGAPANCTCAGTFSAANQYAVRLTSGTDCGVNPGNIVCNVVAEN